MVKVLSSWTGLTAQNEMGEGDTGLQNCPETQGINMNLPTVLGPKAPHEPSMPRSRPVINDVNMVEKEGHTSK